MSSFVHVLSLWAVPVATHEGWKCLLLVGPTRGTRGSGLSVVSMRVVRAPGLADARGPVHPVGQLWRRARARLNRTSYYSLPPPLRKHDIKKLRQGKPAWGAKKMGNQGNQPAI